MADKERVGFVGLGIMGKPMAANIIKAGFPVTVYNRTRSKAEELGGEGAKVAGSPKEVAQQSDITITMVSDSPDVEEVIMGAEGVIQGVREDAAVIDMSTISPQVTQELADALSQKGAHMLDAPVSGGSWGAVQGTLSIMVGGEKDTFDRCLPVFEAMGQRIIYTGGHGMGQVTKLVNQIIVGGTLAAVCEGLLFGAKAGIDLNPVFEAVTGGAAASWQLQNLGARVLKRDFAPGFMVKLMHKDLRLITEAAREMQLPLPLTSLIHQFYHVLQREGHGEEGTQAYIKVMEKLAGVEVKGS
ncbi:MAG: NAD(P)-dependent oxidoreductase [Dehalococcoidia bacterium]